MEMRVGAARGAPGGEPSTFSPNPLSPPAPPPPPLPSAPTPCAAARAAVGVEASEGGNGAGPLALICDVGRDSDRSGGSGSRAVSEALAPVTGTIGDAADFTCGPLVWERSRSASLLRRLMPKIGIGVDAVLLDSLLPCTAGKCTLLAAALVVVLVMARVPLPFVTGTVRLRCRGADAPLSARAAEGGAEEAAGGCSDSARLVRRS